MADNKNFVINVNGDGGVNISEEVVSIIAGLGATEVEGVDSLSGNLTADNIFKAGAGKISVQMSINMKMGFEIPKVCRMVQDKVKQAVETMTGLEVTSVDIKVATVSVA